MATTTISEGTWIGFRTVPTYGADVTIDDSGGDYVAYGSFSLNKIQLGRESSAGTAVAATAVWRGEATDIEDGRTIVSPGAEESIGLLVPSNRRYVSGLSAKVTLPETELTFEQVLHPLEAGIKTATPTGASPYTYTYAHPVTAAVNTIKTYTIETGNALAGDVQEMEYSFVEEMTFSGAYGEAWKMASSWMGRQATAASFTSALTAPTVEEVLFSKTKLYIDATGGTIGSTQITGVLTAAQITIKTGIQQVPVGDGTLYSTVHKFVRPEITGSITIELENTNSTVATERAFYKTQTARLLRLDVAGSTSDRNFQFNAAVQWDGIDTYKNDKGDTVVTFNWSAVYSSTDSLYSSVIVKNLLASVP